MTRESISLRGRGARGESFADQARRLGKFGAEAGDTDAEVLDKVNDDLAAGVSEQIDALTASTQVLTDTVVQQVPKPHGHYPLSTGSSDFVSDTSAVIYTAPEDRTVVEVGTWVWSLGDGSASLAIFSGTAPNFTFVSAVDLPDVTAIGAKVWTTDAASAPLSIALTAGQHLAINAPSGGIHQSTIAASGQTAYFKYPGPLTAGSATFTPVPDTRFTAYVKTLEDDVRVPMSALADEVQAAITAPSTPTCFVMFLIIGQSNAQGYNTSTGTPAIANGWAYQWYGGALTELAGDPVGNSTGSSAWPAFVNRFVQLTGLGVILVPSAVGGSAMVAEADPGGVFGNWSPTGALRTAAITKLNAAKAAADAADLAWQFGGVLISQGEADAVAIDNDVTIGGVPMTGDDWYDGAVGLINYLQTETGSGANMPVIMARTGTDATGDTPGWQAIRAAQMQLARDLPNVFMGFTGAVNFPAQAKMNDDRHYSVQGYDDMGTAEATVAAYRCIGRA